jgi:hypothetical protein
MTWTKLGDEYPAETADMSDAAFRLHTLALCWSNWRLLDLTIPARDLRKFAFIESKPVDDAVDELVAAGWWQRIDSDTYWIGCRFSDWQRDKVQVEHNRERKAQDQRRKRRHDLDDHSLCIPGRCKSLSPGDTPGDSPDRRRGDPGRVGAGRFGEPKVKSGLDKKELPETAVNGSSELHSDQSDHAHWQQWNTPLPESSGQPTSDLDRDWAVSLYDSERG